jgi:hypothetical protein
MGVFADRFTRAIGAAIGLGLVAALIVAARPAGGHGGVLPARLTFTAAQDGAVALTPANGPLLASGPLRPGGHAEGAVFVRNQTGETMAVKLRALPSSTALDGIATVRLTAAGETLADGTLQALRAGSSGALRLAPGAAARVRLRVSIPADIETGYEGRRVAVQIQPSEEAVR